VQLAQNCPLLHSIDGGPYILLYVRDKERNMFIKQSANDHYDDSSDSYDDRYDSGGHLSYDDDSDAHYRYAND
jgi:hypothetical protein